MLADQGEAMSQVTVGRMETGRRPTTVDELLALARIFDTTIGDLVVPLDEHFNLGVSVVKMLESTGRQNALTQEQLAKAEQAAVESQRRSDELGARLARLEKELGISGEEA